MAVQDEVRWVLDTIRTNWPAEWPDDLSRVNRDDPKNLATGKESISIDLERFNAIHAASGSVQREVFGTEPQYRVTTTVDVRVEAKAERDRGNVTNDAVFNELVKYAQYAINSELVYPEVNVAYDDLIVYDGETVVVEDGETRTDNRLRVRDGGTFIVEDGGTHILTEEGISDIGRIIYLNTRIQDEQRLASGDKDYYRTDFTVELRGNADTP